MDLERAEKSAATYLAVGVSDGFEKQKGQTTIMVYIQVKLMSDRGLFAPCPWRWDGGDCKAKTTEIKG